MLENTIEQRIGYLVVSEDDKDTLTNNKVVIHIKNTLPLVMINDATLNVMKYTEVDNPTQENADIISTLVDVVNGKDDDGNDIKVIDKDRFVFINEINNPITGVKVRAYYDNMFNDIIVLPVPVFGGDSDMDNEVLDIFGQRIGGYKDVPRNNDFLLSVKDVFPLPKANNNIATKTIVTNTPGLNKGSKNNLEIYYENTDVMTVMNNSSNPMLIIELGKPSDLFVENKSLPVYSVFQETLQTYNLKFSGIRDVPNTKLYVIITV